MAPEKLSPCLSSRSFDSCVGKSSSSLSGDWGDWLTAETLRVEVHIDLGDGVGCRCK